MRGRLVPGPVDSALGLRPAVPISRSRREQFDDLVLDAVEHLEERWANELDGVEFAVEDVPPLPDGDPVYDPDVVEDAGVPLSRLLPAVPEAAGPGGPGGAAGRPSGRAAGADRSGGARTARTGAGTGAGGPGGFPARIVVYRRPLEARSADRADLADLVLDVVVEQVARLLNLDPDEVDPPEEGG